MPCCLHVIIHHSLSKRAGAAYRNDVHAVAKFFTTRHYGSFQIFNLCEPFEEAGNGNYDRKLFFGQVARELCNLPSNVS
jgi:hypothetical protein